MKINKFFSKSKIAILKKFFFKINNSSIDQKFSLLIKASNFFKNKIYFLIYKKELNFLRKNISRVKSTNSKKLAKKLFYLYKRLEVSKNRFFIGRNNKFNKKVIEILVINTFQFEERLDSLNYSISLKILLKIIRSYAKNIDQFHLFHTLHSKNLNSDKINCSDVKNIVLGVFFFHNKNLINYSYSYLSEIRDENLLYEFCPVEQILSYGSKGIETSKLLDKRYTLDQSNDIISALIKSYSISPDLDNKVKLKTIQNIISNISSNFQIKNNKDNWMFYYSIDRFKKIKESYAIKKSENVINVGIMDYKMLDIENCSCNLGDYVQTISSALAWTEALNCRFEEDSKLGVVLNKILPNTNNISNNGELPIKISPVIVDRDSNLLSEAYEEKLWLVANGWYRHSCFGYSEKYIFAKNIVPIFIAFHLNQTSTLTPDLVLYLKENQPIGCRDWDTVILLKSFGIEAFFSGCLTMTFGDIFKKELPKNKNNSNEAYVDVKNTPINKKFFTQVANRVKETPIEDSLIESFNLLKGYRNFSKIFTSRLHCYLPCTSMGIEVDFIPNNLSDQRFVGLFPLSKNNFQVIRNNMRNNLTEIIKYISKNNPSKVDFSKKWRSIWKEELKEAEIYYEKVCLKKIKSCYFPKKEIINKIKKSILTSHDFNKEDNFIEIAFSFDENLLNAFEVTLVSIIENTKENLRIYIFGRGIPLKWKNYIKNNFPKIIFIFYSLDSVNYGSDTKLIRYTTISTIDRLLIPDILDIPKVLYLDTDLIVNGDIKHLFEIDISNKFMAAVPSLSKKAGNVMDVVVKNSKKLSPEEAKDFRYFCFKNYPNSINKAFNAGVLLMNLKAMRERKLSEIGYSLVSKYQFNDQDCLNLISNGNVEILDSKFNYFACGENVKDPLIIHWAGPVKPWHKNNKLFKEKYEFYRKKIS